MVLWLQRKALIYTIASTLGLLNEVSRPDRDVFVDIESEHVDAGQQFNFAKHSNDYFHRLDIPYDYASIMHSTPNVTHSHSLQNYNSPVFEFV